MEDKYYVCPYCKNTVSFKSGKCPICQYKPKLSDTMQAASPFYHHPEAKKVVNGKPDNSITKYDNTSEGLEPRPALAIKMLNVLTASIIIIAAFNIAIFTGIAIVGESFISFLIGLGIAIGIIFIVYLPFKIIAELLKLLNSMNNKMQDITNQLEDISTQLETKKSS